MNVGAALFLTRERWSLIAPPAPAPASSPFPSVRHSFRVGLASVLPPSFFTIVRYITLLTYHRKKGSHINSNQLMVPKRAGEVLNVGVRHVNTGVTVLYHVHVILLSSSLTDMCVNSVVHAYNCSTQTLQNGVDYIPGRQQHATTYRELTLHFATYFLRRRGRGGFCALGIRTPPTFSSS